MVNIITEYSLMQSLIKIPELIEFLVKNKIKYSGICDDEMYGIMPFYLECKKAGIKPIIGQRIILENNEILVYAKNYEGYLKLIKLKTLKQERTLNIDDINNDNLIIILPYNSKDLKLKNKNIYLGYENNNEKKNSLLLSNKIVYIKKVRALSRKDTIYLKYLNLLGSEFDFDLNEYFNLEIDKDDKKYLDAFAQEFNLEIPFDRKYLPKYNENTSSNAYLSKLASIGLSKRLNKKVDDNYQNRLKEELDTIFKMGFSDYFLIVYDYVLFAKKNGILVGPGRGSAAGSLVSYAIGITDIDPLKYNLKFARFLNPSRSKMPDIDIDFEDERRFEVIDYVKEKYGEKRVALGLTFNTFKPKLILRDLAKALKIEDKLLNKFIKCIDANKSLKENAKSLDVQKYLNLYPDLKELYDASYALENLKKNTSTHAAGVIISPVDLDKIIPVINENGMLKTGYVLDYMEKLGLLKMDFLGLKNLTTIKDIVKTIPDFDLNKINYDDKKTYELFANGDTDDIFQFESMYAKNNLKKLKPSNFMELAIATSLVRPGPANEIDEYIKNKDKKVFTNCPKLDSILKETRGIIIFQEQVMEIFTSLAGYSEAQSDSIRASISKKNEDIMNEEENNFIQRLIQNGYEKDFAVSLFAKIRKFAEYGFNKSHAVSYATISYIMGYLKANYFVNFTLTLLKDTKAKEDAKKYLDVLKRKNVKILKPNINYSTTSFVYKNQSLLLPLTFINGLKENDALKLIEKKNKEFSNIYDFFAKCKDMLNEKLFASLVFSSALNVFGYNNKTLIENYENLYNYAMLEDESLAKPVIKKYDEYDDAFLREKELEIYSFYISNHPSSKYNCLKIKDYPKYLYQNVNSILLVEKVSYLKTKKGDKMAFVKCSDETGDCELTIFSNNIKDLNMININDLVFVSAKVQKRFDKLSIIVNNIKRETKQ